MKKKSMIHLRGRIICRMFLLMVFFVLPGMLAIGQNTYRFPFLNPDLSVEERADDIVSRMTLDEKIGQMLDVAPAIDRLGIPVYNWWNECLHGVGRAGLATVFPQAVGMGATWDEDLILRVSTAISDEARAKHHEFVRNGSRARYQGLTYWTPNINIFRDPRWGRGQETYGEDPFLTGRLGVQFIRGLQGDDPRYFKTVATIKHFVVHSGPEQGRHSFDAVTDQRDFMETYLPQFEMGIKEGKAYSIMCAYNRYNGEACCGSESLLDGILRTEWGFNGFIVSDCGAINDIYAGHKIVQTPAEAAALSVRSGTDLECGSVYRNLKEGVDKKFITEEEIDLAVKRLFIARFRLGMFDPPEMVKYTSIPYSVVDSRENKMLAKETALKSMVLLKNENNTLPLRKDIGTIAVIGPNSDEDFVLLGNYNGTPSDPITPLRGIREKLDGKSKVIYARGTEWAAGMPVFEVIPSEVLFNDGNSGGLKGEYYNNRDFTGDAMFSIIDGSIDMKWGEKAPSEEMDVDNFGIRWTGELVPEVSGPYMFGFVSSCRVRIFIDDALVLSTPSFSMDENRNPRMRRSEPFELEAGKKYNFRVEASETSGEAEIQLLWALPEKQYLENLKNEAINAARQADVVVMCMGITPRLEGEEMNVAVEGFKGGDRINIDLPGIQQDLIRAIHATGKPIVLVLLNGSAIAINWEKENIPAILEAWYPGQEGGAAIADILFGDYNPAGRLPVTFYKTVDDLPGFEDYNMKNRTYRYYTGEALFPFGHGLSYTTFQYSKLKVSKKIKAGDEVTVKVNVTNTGKLAGEEVVQVYVSNLGSEFPVAIRTLKAFDRINLAPGESRSMSFTIPADAFSVVDDNYERVILPGDFAVAVGGHQPQMGGTEKEASILKALVKVQ
ncbi:MAG: glycoside hydrolase family 3 C-terminal domain-containing protein [Bacteroidales bacterium]|jgi:beta-glucosidase|nr:glycoside hydrolase family 3 C-terminal domain-containing protein [Bacteroidales bacterium]